MMLGIIKFRKLIDKMHKRAQNNEKNESSNAISPKIKLSLEIGQKFQLQRLQPNCSVFYMRKVQYKIRGAWSETRAYLKWSAQ